MEEPSLSVKAIFDRALEIKAADERIAYLDQACANLPEFRQKVEALLRAYEDAGSFLESPAAAQAVTLDQPVSEQPGTVIGPYKLLQQIGEGGFGTVFMAEQTQPVQRKVALKVIKAGMDSKQVIARFEAERQALAMMDHVNIARVFDAGETPPAYAGASPRPYFVMELVHGVPITKYCDDNHLTPRERLELFVPVCLAIQHAHQKGIIHRDIKPSNVMITLYDGKPVPKVIDFGVAKATEQRLTERTLFTQFGTMVGTLEYMSPEQAEMSALGADTRSDIYSLGVLLYELLTGSTPLSHKRLKEAAYSEVLRMIKEEQPPRPSARLSDSGEALASISAQRHMEPAKLTKLVRGELDWIVMKCLEKDRNRRYETASAFAADVQRYLADEAVLACPPSAWYRFRKFARRNKRTLVTAALLGAMLLVLAGSFGWMARDRAAQRGRNADAVAALLGRCEEALENDDAVRAALAFEQAEKRAREGGAEHQHARLKRCETELGMLRELDRIDDLRWMIVEGQPQGVEKAAAECPNAFARYGIVPGTTPVDEAARRVNGSMLRERLLNSLDWWLARSGSSDVLALLRAADPDPFRDAVRSVIAMGLFDNIWLALLASHPAALEQPARFASVLGGCRVVPPARREQLLVAALRRRPGDLGLLMTLSTLYPLNSTEAAVKHEKWLRAAVAVRPQNTGARYNLGNALFGRGDLDGAMAEYNEAIRLDPKYVFIHNNLGILLRSKGNLDGAMAEYKEVIRLDPKYTPAHYNLGNALVIKGDLDGAIAAYREAVNLEPKNTRFQNALDFVLKLKAERDVKHRIAPRGCHGFGTP